MSKEIDDFLLSQIRRHEGFRNKPYKDTVGKLTIGYGRNLDDVGIFPNEAEIMLANDLQRSVEELSIAFPWYSKLSQRRKQAMVNFHFNVGMPTVGLFKKFLAAMEAGAYETAGKELLDSRYARQVKGRATELAKQIQEG